MGVALLSPERAAVLRAAPLTYPVGGADAPAGYLRFSRSRVLRCGWEEAAEALLTWQVHLRSGLSVSASATRIGLGEVVDLRLGPRPVGIVIPCRIVRVDEEDERRGFAYGTLPGHPESGEETFLLTRGPDGTVTFTVSAFSRPASRLARVGGPVTRLAQRAMTTRYLRAPDR